MRAFPAATTGLRARRRRSTGRWIALGAALAAMLLLAGLGVWQLERRAWKHALIERVESRVHAPPAAPPAPARWAAVDREHDEYRRLRLTGRWLPGRSTRVMAVTRLGAGCWLLTPLQQDDGSIVLVNRGFLGEPPDRPRDTADAPTPTAPSGTSACSASRGPPEPPPGPAEATGLLRLSEPGGGFLRQNDPADDRWFSHDVAAIAAARGLDRVAPFFVDADAAPAVPGIAGQPVGGLTVVRFRDDHLVYALTWFALAAIAGAAAWHVGKPSRAAGA